MHGVHQALAVNSRGDRRAEPCEVVLEQRNHTVVKQISRRNRRLAIVELSGGYLGDRQKNTLKDAFLLARNLVLKRELRQGFEPSHPQMAGGGNVEPLLVARPN
jgi:hypothetical protein